MLRLGGEALPSSLPAKLNWRLDWIVSAKKDFFSDLPSFEWTRSGKRDRKKNRIAENYLLRLVQRKREMPPFMYELPYRREQLVPV